jgi:histidinol-phosphate phosphatase family protein
MSIKMFNPSSVTAAILAGGFGKRLRSVVFKQPKVLAEVHKRPFLQILLEHLHSFGFRNAVICTGYLGDQIKERFGDNFKSLKLEYSHEPSPLGTAGSLKWALPLFRSDHVLVMNGDSFCEVNLHEFGKFHLAKDAYASLVLAHLPNTDRFGRVNHDPKDQIVSFEEKKEGSGAGWINAGIYLIKKSILSEIPDNAEVSLEREIFPKWIGRKFHGYKTSGRFIDIGTPESYGEATEFFKNHWLTNRFIILDRDGTIIVHKPYLSHPDQIELIPGVIEALKEFKKMGLGIVLITNQSGVGRGYFDLKTLKKIHQRLSNLLAEEGIFLDDIFFCPHTPEENCSCRKPKNKLVKKAAQKHNFDPKLSFVIGDNKSDIELGKHIGATTLLVRTGYGSKVEIEEEVSPNFIVDNLRGAIPILKKNIKMNSL